MKRKLLALFLSAFVGGSAMAQDVHFTQFFTSPLTLNPALTGLVNKDYRLAANYRNQWYSVSTPYITGTASFDIAALKGKLDNGDAVGVGLILLYDRSGTGALQNTTAGISLAYHKAFGEEKNHHLSLGLQGYLVQKSVDFSKIVFENDIDVIRGVEYVGGGGGETNLGGGDLTYPDFNTGLMYSGRVSEHATLFAGGAYYHLSQPTETFLNSSNKINARYNFYVGGSIDLNDYMVMYASGLYQKQGKAQETMIGGAAGFILNPLHDEYTQNTVLYLGGWYRVGDAVNPYIGFEWEKMTFGISYDVNLSNFAPATKNQGALEVSLIYNGGINRYDRPKYNFTCPKF